MSPLATLYALWLLFFLSWIAASLLAGPTIKEGSFWLRLLHRLIILAGFGLLFGLYIPPFFPLNPFWRIDDQIGWILAAGVFLGFAFAWWSRIVQSRAILADAIHNPSLPDPHKKGDMRAADGKHVYLLVESGPFAIVRHPVSTGVIFAALATAIAIGTAISILGAFLIILGYWLRGLGEDAVLQRVLGEDYRRYASRVSMIVPFGPKRRNRSNGTEHREDKVAAVEPPAAEVPPGR